MKFSSTTFIVLAASGQALGSWNHWLRDVTVTETVTRAIQSCPCNGEEQSVTPLPRSEGVQHFRKPGPPVAPFGPPSPQRPGKPLSNTGPNNEPWANWFGPPPTKSPNPSSTSASSRLLSSSSSAGPFGGSASSRPNGYPAAPNSSTSLSSSISSTSSREGSSTIRGSISSSPTFSTSTSSSFGSSPATTVSPTSISSSLGPVGGTSATSTSTTLAASTTPGSSSTSSVGGNTTSSSSPSSFSTSFITTSSSTPSTSSSTDSSPAPTSSSLRNSSTIEGPASTTTLLTTTSGATAVTTSSSISTTTTASPVAVVTADVSSFSPTDAILEAHNVHRVNHTAANLTWSENLASIAADIAATCIYAHNTTAGGGGYGQNIGAGYTPNRVPAMIGNSMYNMEMPNYPLPYGQDNVDVSNFNNWGHFSQIVWKDTREVGCATQYCPNGLANTGSGTSPYFTVCNYSPAGMTSFHLIC
ncbi:hypothetical protein CLCR_05827 [Cladophialophora carrionii]|uniref:SCP domain-containing protein n=1 Tax=Cladophialophora carrionii TaxID=86049 RepID=A0A1C1CA57_9EURO|nr:hypothetical protein CLCR_05827 [Cladophialophora carrionii]